MDQQKSVDLWNRAANIKACSSLRDVKVEEGESIMEVSSLLEQEEKLSSAERMLKMDLIEAYEERKKRIEKMEKILEIADGIKTSDRELRNSIWNIVHAEDENFARNLKKTVVVKNKKAKKQK